MGGLSVLLIFFGVISLLTALILDNISSRNLLREQVPMQETVVGPFKISERDKVLSVRITHDLPSNSWNFVTGSLLDENKRYLIGFGGEMWREGGESESSYTAKINVQQPGQYFLRLKPKTDLRGNQRQREEYWVEASIMPFSTVPHFAFGLILLIVGAVMNFAAGGFVKSLLEED